MLQGYYFGLVFLYQAIPLGKQHRPEQGGKEKGGMHGFARRYPGIGIAQGKLHKGQRPFALVDDGSQLREEGGKESISL